MRSFHSIHNDVDGGVLQAMWGANLYTTINTHYLPTMPILCKRSIEERPLGGGQADTTTMNGSSNFFHGSIVYTTWLPLAVVGR